MTVSAIARTEEDERWHVSASSAQRWLARMNKLGSSLTRIPPACV
eukprot:CAMPEP_0170286188 /NCGR_PEP_ID=MMETSP0116_2-20130129/43148_1 /TAXON_ID=400756 /ORGANISM="Durinskia baltica, Strain CSIRO CS-38" /LENGTH=44 /DNA_ID= /DNA_START= /DNA_END= /DNA_ORIENTATION=